MQSKHRFISKSKTKCSVFLWQVEKLYFAHKPSKWQAKKPLALCFYMHNFQVLSKIKRTILFDILVGQVKISLMVKKKLKTIF